MELYREEKKEAGDRGGQKDKRGKMKRRETDPASNQFPFLASSLVQLIFLKIYRPLPM